MSLDIRSPEPTAARTTRGFAAEWHLEQDADGITARSAAGPSAGVSVVEDDDRVRLEFWISGPQPQALLSALTSSVFDHPAMRSHRPVLATLPHGEPQVLAELCSHLCDVRTYVAGSTCLLDGRVA
jgi:hypothetical protein